jgi:hypothetical protein
MCSSFETRDVCEDVIKNYNNTPVSKNGGEEHIIQIRYSDTHEQKMLKQQTAAARQFRAAEFEFGCLQTGRTGPNSAERLLNNGGAAPNDFDAYLQSK